MSQQTELLAACLPLCAERFEAYADNPSAFRFAVVRFMVPRKEFRPFVSAEEEAQGIKPSEFLQVSVKQNVNGNLVMVSQFKSLTAALRASDISLQSYSRKEGEPVPGKAIRSEKGHWGCWRFFGSRKEEVNAEGVTVPGRPLARPGNEQMFQAVLPFVVSHSSAESSEESVESHSANKSPKPSKSSAQDSRIAALEAIILEMQAKNGAVSAEVRADPSEVLQAEQIEVSEPEEEIEAPKPVSSQSELEAYVREELSSPSPEEVSCSPEVARSAEVESDIPLKAEIRVSRKKSQAQSLPPVS